MTTSVCIFQNFPIEVEAPVYDIVEITPNELEAIVGIHNPAVEHLVYPADYLEVLQGGWDGGGK